MKYPPVTVACLIYKSPSWLAWFLEGLAWSRNRTPYRTLVVGNDAEPQVMETGRVDVDHRNPPGMSRMARIYAAWNRCVEEAETDLVCLANSDFAFSDWWLDRLVDVKLRLPMSLPCSLLVESGRIPSAFPEFVKQFGEPPDNFDINAWQEHALMLRASGKESVTPGRLYMPVIFRKDEFIKAGGYPSIGNPEGTTGDKDLFARYKTMGFEHLTVMDSVVFHQMCGEAGGWYSGE